MIQLRSFTIKNDTIMKKKIKNKIEILFMTYPDIEINEFKFLIDDLEELFSTQGTLIQEDLKSVIRFLEGDCPREKIINYIKKYLVK